jgi:hypothetical protein
MPASGSGCNYFFKDSWRIKSHSMKEQMPPATSTGAPPILPSFNALRGYRVVTGLANYHNGLLRYQSKAHVVLNLGSRRNWIATLRPKCLKTAWYGANQLPVKVPIVGLR